MTKSIILISALFTYITLSLATNALANIAQRDEVHRYMPGNFSEVVNAIAKPDHGALSVGNDVADFAKKQLSAWQKNPSEVPDSVKKLASSPEVDGRRVTEKEKIFNPPEKPNFPTKSVSKRSNPLPVPQPLPSCAGADCGHFSDCARPCNACFFPAGPPAGICLV
ncbi:hypothetical protein EV356DRAFT_553755 [Viridothelium virens]|uniref:Uncharacterized protein n=1 Tax=Viridothelium virens TaxID=1048519 RepID=A0A6A6HKI7_VIRVR|nr:hypothetical protein EV356DRAFT_553755 [Viridothelium virens]